MSRNTILNENRAYWTQRAASYSEVNRGELSDEHRENWRNVIVRQIREQFPERKAEDIRVLEVGTGPGFFAIILAEAGYHVTAIDLTPSMLEQARENAGILSERIDFREMNAEALTFPEESFDVVVTRNLTWNLPHPEAAYADWRRVLKAGGLLLNFDANWYGYLFDDAAKAAYDRDRQTAAERGLEDQNVGENFDVMEDIALRIPLSSVLRPEWDLKLLAGMGMTVTADRQIWKQVWSESERVAFASTPMFLVQAIR